MVKKKNQNVEQDSFDSLEEQLTKTESFIETHQKTILIVVTALVLVVGAYMAYNNLYLKSVEQDAQASIFHAEKYFEVDSFDLALKGDGNNFGVLDIIDNYGVSKSANLANFYAGVSYLHKGDFDKAIEYLSDFSSDDVVISAVAIGAIGDAYMEKGNKEKARDFYLKAAKHNTNNFSTPIYLMKAGKANEILGQPKEALEIYEMIKADFPTSNEGRIIDKYITRAKMKI